MSPTAWYVLVGFLLIGVALVRTRLSQWPLSLSQLYLGVGVALGALGFGVLDIHPIRDSRSWSTSPKSLSSCRCLQAA